MRGGLLAAALGALCSTACFVEVREVADPGPAFARAHARANRVAGRAGPAQELHVLAYDRDDRQLVEAHLPIALARKMAEEGDLDDLGIHDGSAEKVRDSVKLSDLEKLPLGVLVEVEERKGDRVLVWLQ
jgi:hypothetical protein